MAAALSPQNLDDFGSSVPVSDNNCVNFEPDLCAKDFADYLKVDLTSQVKCYQDIIEDMLVRLDEFSQTADMICNESGVVTTDLLPRILSQTKQIATIFPKINQLERFMEVVSRNVDKLEEKVNKAESDLGVPTFKGFLHSFSVKRFRQKKEVKKTDKVEWIPIEFTDTKQYFQRDLNPLTDTPKLNT